MFSFLEKKKAIYAHKQTPRRDSSFSFKVAIYARVSTDDKGQDVEIQLDRCRKYCEAMGWASVEYVDHESAYRKKGEDRPQFMAMLEAIRTHQVRGVVVYQMDRFSREDPMKVTSYLLEIVRDHKAIFVSMSDGVDSRSEVFPVIERIMAWQANNWSKAHGQRVKAGIARERAKAEANGEKFHWGRPPIWESRQDPKIILRAKQMRSQGTSWTTIAQKLGIGRTTARRLCQKAQQKVENVLGTSGPPISDSGLEKSPSPHQDCTHKRSDRHTGGGKQ